jgi:ribose 5-phosphate isomerase B
MRIALGADHAGFVLKEELRQVLEKKGHEVVDEGTHSAESCDYPDFAAAVACDVNAGRAERGILVCSTGVGMSIAANKFPGIRAALGSSADEVRLTRSHNDANVLTLGARYIDAPAAAELVDIFLETGFDGGRHARRLAKIGALEHRNGSN